MQIKTKAIVLKVQDYNEDDRLLTLLTEERGLVYVYAFGAKKMKSRFSAVCSPLCYGEFVLFKNREKYNLDSAESERLFFGIREDMLSLAYASYFCEVAISISTEEEPAAELMRLLLNTLHLLESKKHSFEKLKAVFELRSMCISGYEPELAGCSVCGGNDKKSYWFDVQNGSLTCAECKPSGKDNEMLLSESAYFAARHIVYSPLERIFSFRLGEGAEKELSAATENYVLVQTDKKYPTADFLNSVKMIYGGETPQNRLSEVDK